MKKIPPIVVLALLFLFLHMTSAGNANCQIANIAASDGSNSIAFRW